MSLAFQIKTRPQTISLEEVQTFLYAEARALDDREWDAWLACYAPDATFHMPAWDDDDLLTEDPQREISLIYYGSKQGLEDPNADLLEIFDAIENLPNKPKQMFDEFRKWARGDYEDQIRSGGGKGGSGCG